MYNPNEIVEYTEEEWLALEKKLASYLSSILISVQ